MLVSHVHVAATFLLLLAAGAMIGMPVSRWFDTHGRMRVLIAPALGLGLYGAIAINLFHLVAFTPWTIAGSALLAFLVSFMLGRLASRSVFESETAPSLAWVIAALLVAAVPALATMPTIWHGNAWLNDSIFDHAKAAIIDEIAQNGIPAHNPFYQQASGSNLLNYYYLSYLIAAAAARITGSSGWAADIAFTAVSAFSCLAAMAWAAVAYGRRTAAAWWVLAISFTATLRPVVAFVWGPWLNARMVPEHGLETWLVQAIWVPQHLFAATLATFAWLGLVTLLRRERIEPALCVVIGALVAASYGSSAWVGGLGLALILPPIGLIGLVLAARDKRAAPTLGNLALAGLVALALAGTFIAQQLSLVGTRTLVELWVFPVIPQNGSLSSSLLNALLYWVLLMPLEFGFAYLMSVGWALFRGDLRRSGGGLLNGALLVAFLVPLITAQTLHSVIANNDLAWRIVLIAVLAMTVIAAALAARVVEQNRQSTMAALMVLAVGFLGPALMSGAQYAVGASLEHHLYGQPSPDTARFQRAPQMWAAVREVTLPDEAIANNPLDLASLTPWPGNIGWALLSGRRHCSGGLEWLRAYAPSLTPERARQVGETFRRIFRGDVAQDDLKMLRDEHLCRTLVVVPNDGLWGSSELENSPYFKLARAQEGEWRIYRAQ